MGQLLHLGKYKLKIVWNVVKSNSLVDRAIRFLWENQFPKSSNTESH